MKIFVFAENTNALLELSFGMRERGYHVEAIAIGEINGSFADKVWMIPFQYGVPFHGYAGTIASLIKKEKPNILLMESTKRCKLIADQLASTLGITITNDIEFIRGVNNTPQLVNKGDSVKKEQAANATKILMVDEDAIKVSRRTEVDEDVETIEFIPPLYRTKKYAVGAFRFHDALMASL